MAVGELKENCFPGTFVSKKLSSRQFYCISSVWVSPLPGFFLISLARPCHSLACFYFISIFRRVQEMRASCLLSLQALAYLRAFLGSLFGLSDEKIRVPLRLILWCVCSLASLNALGLSFPGFFFPSSLHRWGYPRKHFQPPTGA